VAHLGAATIHVRFNVSVDLKLDCVRWKLLKIYRAWSIMHGCIFLLFFSTMSMLSCMTLLNFGIILDLVMSQFSARLYDAITRWITSFLWILYPVFLLSMVKFMEHKTMHIKPFVGKICDDMRGHMHLFFQKLKASDSNDAFLNRCLFNYFYGWYKYKYKLTV
jgi:hypothetical protein